MSLKVAYCVFYVGFISILLFFSTLMGTQIIFGVETEDLQIPAPPTAVTLLDSLTYLFNIAVFGITTFGYLVLINTTYAMLFFFVILPLSAGFLWSLIELARGN